MRVLDNPGVDRAGITGHGHDLVDLALEAGQQVARLTLAGQRHDPDGISRVLLVPVATHGERRLSIDLREDNPLRRNREGGDFPGHTAGDRHDVDRGFFDRQVDFRTLG